MRKYIFVALGLISLFLFFRFYQLSDSLVFFGDMGRDLFELLQWQETGKPPLLGPLTSTVPFNHSALYYYLLFPIAVLTNFSAYSAIYTNALLYVGMLLFGFYTFRKNTPYLQIIFLVFLLLTLHPLVILQNRYVWNPSFVPPFLSVAFMAFVLLKTAWKTRTLFLFTGTLALALAMSYSIIPTFLAFLLFPLLFFRRAHTRISYIKKRLYTYVALVISVLMVYLPTIIFELRHNFFLTKRLFSFQSPLFQVASFHDRVTDVLSHVFVVPSELLQLLLFGAVIVLFVLNIHRIKTSHGDDRDHVFFQALVLLILTSVITLAAPFQIHAHYMFGLLTLLFFVIASMRIPYAVMSTILFLLIFLQPSVIGSYFTPATRTVSQLQQCAQRVCSTDKEPLFVSVQAGFHPYHIGNEYRYFFKKYGCNIQEIEKNTDAATRMALVEDNAVYEHGKTQFYELDLFGNSTVERIHHCEGNINVYILQKE